MLSHLILNEGQFPKKNCPYDASTRHMFKTQMY